MGNDDSLTFDAVAHLKIIDVSCPQQMLALMKWVMAGNRGLLYVRVMRTPSAVLYDAAYQFEFGRGAFVHGTESDAAFIVSSGRGVHEAIAAARACAQSGTHVAVVDMPSIERTSLRLGTEVVPCRAEQRIHSSEPQKVRHGAPCRGRSPSGVPSAHQHLDGRSPALHHSGTYEELIRRLAPAPRALAPSPPRRQP
jgi:hypothetical protein